MLRVPFVALILAVSVTGAAHAQVVFEAPVHHPLPDIFPIDVIAADFDGDGDIDVIAPSTLGSSYGFLAGDGLGGLAEPQDLNAPVALGLREGLVTDHDVDGTLDLVMRAQESVLVVTGNGDGTFQPGPVYDIGASVTGIAFGEFTGDGVPDLAVCSGFFIFSSGVLEILRGDAAGGFDTVLPVDSTPGVSWSGVAAGDVDGNGLDDIIGTSTLISGPTLFLSQPGELFVEAAPLRLSATPAPRLFELTGDGLSDLVMVEPEGVTVHQSHGDGTFSSPVSLPPTVTTGSLGVTAADLNGDGLSELLFAVRGQTDWPGVTVFHNEGDLAFSPIGTLPAEGTDGASFVTAADLDGEGFPDLVWAATERVITSKNHTYGPRSPWIDLGHALDPMSGPPILLADGSLESGDPTKLTVQLAPAGTLWLVLGFDAGFAPLHGGTLVPTPDRRLGPFVTDGVSDVVLETAWPAGLAPGLELWMQAWVAADGGDVAASNALLATVP